jgi:hypothetical protein
MVREGPSPGGGGGGFLGSEAEEALGGAHGGGIFGRFMWYLDR